MVEMKIKSIYVPCGKTKKTKYLVTYENGCKFWYDLTRATFRDEQKF